MYRVVGKQFCEPLQRSTNKIISNGSRSTQPKMWSAVCACSKFLYLCGGTSSRSLWSTQVLRYNPLENSFETLTPMKFKKHCAAAIFHQGCLYVLGGYHGSSFLQPVEKYDPETKVWTTLTPLKWPHYAFGVAALEGKLYVCGNYIHSNIVEVYDPVTDRWQTVANTNVNRHFSAVVAHEGKLLTIGGKNEKTIEVYDPSEDKWQTDLIMSLGLQMDSLIGGLISSSCITNTN